MTVTRQKAKAGQRVRSATARASRLMPPTGIVDDLVESLAADQGRPIRMLAEDLGPREPSGMWIATEKADWIVVPTGVGSAQRTAIICHELAHILLGHTPIGADGDLDALVSLVAPDLDPAVARQILARYCYSDDLEAEAEALGTLLVTKLAHRAERLRMTDDAVSDRLR